MALQKKEKMFKALVIVAVLSAIILYRNKSTSYNVILGSQGEEIVEEIEKNKSTTVRSLSKNKQSFSSSNFLGGISLATFEKHISPKDCWITIDDDVYDATALIKNSTFDIGKDIASYCGTLGFKIGYIKDNPQSIKLLKEHLSMVGILE